MTKTPEPILIALCALLPGCFNPKVDPDAQTDSGGSAPTSDGTGGTETMGQPTTTSPQTSAEGSGTEGPESTATATATATEGPDTSGTDSVGSPPEIVSFTVDGGSQASIDRSGAVAIELEVVDDGEIAAVSFLLDGEPIQESQGPGWDYSSEAIFSGAIDNGGRQLTVVVEDDDGNQTQGGPLLVQVSVPNGGLDEAWRVPGGFAYGVAVSSEGDNVVVSGIAQASLGAAASGGVRRLQGGAWASESIGQSVTIADIVSVGDDFWAAGAIPSGPGRDTHFLHFNDNGALVDASLVDAAVDAGAGENGVDFARRIRPFDGGDFLIMGGYEPADGSPPVGSYVARVTPSGDLAWLDLVSASGTFDGVDVFVYDAVVTPQQEVLLVGSAQESGTTQLWWGRLDSDGDLISESTLEGEYFESIGYAVSAGVDGSFALGGTRRTSSTAQWRRWLRKFDSGGVGEWTREGPADTGFVQGADLLRPRGMA